MKILLGITASVACIKAGLLIQQLSRIGEVRVVITHGVHHLIDPSDIQCKLYQDEDEWDSFASGNGTVLHIELAKWADVFIIAPLSANTMAKLAIGLSDNLLTCVARAWNLNTKRFIVAPAMNTVMWNHPITSEHIATLRKWKVEIIDPIEKTLFCGDIGVGAMEEVDRILHRIQHKYPDSPST